MLKESKNLALIESNNKNLKERVDKLSSIDSIIPEDELLLMKDSDFDKKYQSLQSAFLEKKAEEIRIKEQEINRQKELEEARIEATKIAENKQKLEQEQKAKEDELKKQKELEQAEKTKKNKSYQNFLKENNFDENTMKVERDSDTFTIWKRINTTTIK